MSFWPPPPPSSAPAAPATTVKLPRNGSVILSPTSVGPATPPAGWPTAIPSTAVSSMVSSATASSTALPSPADSTHVKAESSQAEDGRRRRGGGQGEGDGAGDGGGDGDDGGRRASSITATPGAETGSEVGMPLRKKQKRNKPTLSCFECVERKTKCDRARPCLSCMKRQTTCRYNQLADLLEKDANRAVANGRRMTKPPKRMSTGPGDLQAQAQLPNVADKCFVKDRAGSRGSIAQSTALLSHVPYSMPSASKIFGTGSEHPFANYWTYKGGLPQVIAMLPPKHGADALLEQYFECVDPVYPMVHRQTFYADYQHLWSLPEPERDRADAALVALIFVMLALGTQFHSQRPYHERKQSAETYASAANQALRVGSYLSTASLLSVQAMVLIVYFLINDNHASDGWSFAGIAIRQAYAMGLHRDPNIVTPNASLLEKQQRRKLWQAVLLQDTFMTVLLSLPPSATHTDVNVDDFAEDAASIARSSSSGSSSSSSSPLDMAYIRASWTLANLVQDVICSPRALDLPICTTTRHRSKLLADFRAVHRAFPDVFRASMDDADALAALAASDKRALRQLLFLSSNYHHNLMLVHASALSSAGAGGGLDHAQEKAPLASVRGALEAAHEAIGAFFALCHLFADEAHVWWVFNHRAFLEALCIGSVLRDARAAGKGGAEEDEKLGPVCAQARTDISKMIAIMKIMGEGELGLEVARTRVTVLSEYL